MKKIALSFLLGGALLLPISALAASANTGNPRTGNVGNPEDSVTLDNPLGDINSFEQLISTILDAAFIIGLPVAVLFIVIAGFRFVIARGNEKKLTDAKNNLMYTVIGLGVFFGAWTLAKIIESTIKALGVGS
jgi:hypothetical protein